MAAHRLFTGGAWRTAARRVRRIGGAWRTATRSVIYKGGVWHDAATYIQPLTASVNGDAFGMTSGHFGQTVTSNNVVVMPSGGLGPYTYSCAVGNGIAVTNPGGAITAFSKFLSPFTEAIAVATFTVTDSLGSTAFATAEVDLIHEGL